MPESCSLVKKHDPILRCGFRQRCTQAASQCAADRAAIRRFFAVALKRFGYDVLSASNGGDGLEIFKGNREAILFVIVDMSMPVLSGGEVIRGIQKLSPDAKIIATSGHGEGELKHVSMARVFLKKPFTLEQLVRAIDECSCPSSSSKDS